ncbi:hypothetical protein [Pseudogracilibacillus sp. SO30301A]|uniref:hypothetical protein n=1 Tax=Pseudogracilibacillus sp. SO30301A TaxID=3098291 RepID=UPI00300DC2CD
MKTMYIVLLILISIIINIFSINNFLLIMCSILLLLLIFVTSLLTKLVNKASSVKEKDKTIISETIARHGSEGMTRRMNQFALIFSLIVIYAMAIAAFFLQVNDKARSSGITFLNSWLGWIIFVVSLLLVTVHVFRMMKQEAIFRK